MCMSVSSKWGHGVASNEYDPSSALNADREGLC